ncbi:MAG: aldo/keto reductase [Candidatus Omnitrophica bacterium]|nr:aldo/keto reductase [Candidatus Omnitrophota bacterium]MBU1047776.1 aldo/keto reductase [Candidatus Omnitrophota bacterium]MBU1631056.1 aldo/keto reductase [Candidatus Omnitrophota bacterium]MBU1889323.1 aldo/keto reductase [Candidatus Omnitrophota bacterium]
MKYRKFGKLDYQISALSLGCMRLPTQDNKSRSGEVDEKEAVRLIRSAIDRGVNYIDTAYPYHNGNSEIITGKALGDGYRSKVKLATKSPLWSVNSPGDFDKFLNEQLKKLQTEHIDFYLLHGIDKKRWDNVVLKFDLLKKAEAAIADGRIGHLGFSFHDNCESFKLIVDGYEHWDFCLIQYNYMDIENQAGTKGLHYAASKGLAVIVMEPLLGGRLANPPAEVQKVFEEYGTKRSPVQWALQWLWNQPEVTSVISGMSSMQQLNENLQTVESLSTQSLLPEDMEFIKRVRSAFLKRAVAPCTKCGYCLLCPQGVDIPWILELYNSGIIYDDISASHFAYTHFVPEANRANVCTQCGQCDEKCPQGINPSKLMPEIHEKLK